MHTPGSARSSVFVSALLAVFLVLAGCDSTGGMGDDDNGGNDSQTQSTQVSGRVTDNSKSAQSGATTAARMAKAGVEGATVTAVSVAADGSTTQLEGEATTSANGSFTLDAEGEGANGIVIVTAESGGDVVGRTVVKVDGRSSVQAAPMTGETTAEAAVYLEAEARDDSDEDGSDGDDSDGEDEHGTTTADVAAHVDAELAAEINSGATSSSEVAAAIVSSVRAKQKFMAEAETDVEVSAVAEAKESTYLALQSSLAAASSVEARTQAKQVFEEAMADVHAAAGASAEMQAKIRQAATTVAIESAAQLSGNASAELRQKAEILRAVATAKANEARFEAAGASEASVQALADARAQLVADIRANGEASVSAIEDAKATYRSEVESAVEAGLDVSSTAYVSATTAIEAALSTLKSTVTASAEATASAYATFFANAESAAASALEGNANAQAAAKVIVMTEVF
jgi:heme exporter protein D